jgi:hypothetical protein
MSARQTPLPLFLSIVRALAQLQFLASALGLAFYVYAAVVQPNALGADTAAVTLEVEHPRQGQLRASAYDSLAASRAAYPHRLVPQSEKLRLVYRERSYGKLLALNLLGLTNKAQGRSSVPLTLYSMLTALTLYRILHDTRLESPFTEVNARRIRWLGVLMIGIDLYQYLAYAYLRAIVPPLPLPGLGQPVTQYLVLDPATTGGSWKFGLVLLVVAAVYQRGVVMAQEAELTV